MGEKRLSDDGKWEWDGSDWVPVSNEAALVDETSETVSVPPWVEKKTEEPRERTAESSPSTDFKATALETKTMPLSNADQADNADKMLTILAICVLVFSAITGILSQQFTKIEEQASIHEGQATQLRSEARAEEALENQLLLREDILLTEVKSLILTNDINTDELNERQSILENLVSELYVEFDAYELLEWSFSDGTSEPDLLSLCWDIEWSCDIEYSEPNFFNFVRMNVSVSTGVNEVLDERLENLYNSEHDFFEYDAEVDFDSFEIILSNDVEVNSTFLISVPLQFNPIFEGYFGLYWYEYDLRAALSDAEWAISNLEYELENLSSAMSSATSNAQMYISQANTLDMIGELYYNDGLVVEANAYWSMMDENQTLANEQIDLHNELNSTSNDFRQQMLEQQAISQIYREELSRFEKADLEVKLDNQWEKLESKDNEYEEEEQAYSATVDTINRTDDLVDRLFAQSAAHSNGTIDSETGEYRSLSVQTTYYETVHAPSSSLYNASAEEQRAADDIRAELSELSTAVMLVSIGNVILGITGGMVTKAKQGKGNKRNIMILLGAGALTGGIGSLQAIGMMF